MRRKALDSGWVWCEYKGGTRKAERKGGGRRDDTKDQCNDETGRAEPENSRRIRMRYAAIHDRGDPIKDLTAVRIAGMPIKRPHASLAKSILSIPLFPTRKRIEEIGGKFHMARISRARYFCWWAEETGFAPSEFPSRKTCATHFHKGS